VLSAHDPTPNQIPTKPRPTCLYSPALQEQRINHPADSQL
jgi:hypothetical protein